jgi:hypothetical protein
MPNFEVDYKYSVREWGTEIINAADSTDDAERLTRERLKNDYPDIFDIEIEGVREIKTETDNG